MALKELTLSALEDTKLKEMFQEKMNEISFSLSKDADVPGDRKIWIEMTFSPKDGYLITTYECGAKMPGRKVSSIATFEDHKIKIDTVSGDSRQPDLYDNHKVTPITAAKKEGAAS